jgi:hypothetical protein
MKCAHADLQAQGRLLDRTEENMQGITLHRHNIIPEAFKRLQTELHTTSHLYILEACVCSVQNMSLSHDSQVAQASNEKL